ncbi:2Fe-2S iron-sulfur cluster-binding protein [Glaciimonas soli]|uniref:(2Fe-2S)-binding protein n=1 Tax=Glaciimonas soli TaxID=2590999 RepID=A0A843YMS4_9BURK|nr:2Fe-2S iron-sulfur cluster-binding protein [Glaciimonas soli]MQR00765.1 (2Fe-2S)-binding protein [Glaciimonas soli]
MADDLTITVHINGHRVTVVDGCSVAAALSLAAAGAPGITRRSVSGMLRAPLCGMGICQECRVTIDGNPYSLACQTICVAGMQIETAQVSS